MNLPYIPKELLHIILNYYGRIKYEKGKYINIIYPKDYRYDIIKKVLLKKKEIMETIELNGSSFYFEFGFDNCYGMGLCYDYNFTYKTKFEISYYNTIFGLEQIRTYI